MYHGFSGKVYVYDPSYLLLKEARESWQYAKSNELVYSLDPCKVTLDTIPEIAKQYIKGNVWIECHLVFEGDGDTHHAIIVIEYDQVLDVFGDIRESEYHSRPMNGNTSVLVEVAHPIEPDQKVALDGCCISSVVRLKRFNNCRCFNGDPLGLSGKSLDILGAIGIENRELGVLWESDSQASQRVNELVQRRPQAVEDVPNDQRDSVRSVTDCGLNAVASCIKIIITKEGIRLRVAKHGQLIPQAVEVFLRPYGLKVGIG